MSHAALIEMILADQGFGALQTLKSDPALCTRDDDPSALMLALYRGHAEIAEIIVKRRRGFTVFEAAAMGNAAGLARGLRVAPASVRAVAADGFTALHLACFFGHLETAIVLLRAGANPNALAANGTQVRPLHSGAANGSVEVCRALLAAGADPNLTQQGGYTPLHAAANRGNVAIAGLLLGYGARRDARAEDGRIAADIARQAGYLALADALEVT